MHGGTHGDFHVQDDGKLLDPLLGSDTEFDHGQWYSPAEPFGHRGLPGNTWELAGNRTLHVVRVGDVTHFTAHAIGAPPAPLLRAHAETLGLIGTVADRARVPFDGERVAWAETRCGATTVYTHRVGEPATVSRSFLDRRCARAVLPKRPLRVSRAGRVLLPVRCVEMRRCAGLVRAILPDGTTGAKTYFDFARRSRGVVRVTLTRAGRRAPRARFELLDRDRLELTKQTLALRR
jgi:hypothetical protein